MTMIPITDHIAIDEKEIQYEFIRASGPGGQHVNKVATAVQLRFDVNGSPNLPNEARVRLKALGGKKLTAQGILVIEAKRFRSQEKNRQDALDRLVALIQKACAKRRPRRKTKPTKASIERKLAEKKRRSYLKKMRRPVKSDWN